MFLIKNPIQLLLKKFRALRAQKVQLRVLRAMESCDDAWLVEYFSDHKEELNKEYLDGDSLLHLAAKYGCLDFTLWLLESNHSVFIQNQRGQTPLYLAIEQGQAMIVQALLRVGLNPNGMNDDGQRPLHWAAALCEGDIGSILIQEGANPYLQNAFNQTAFEVLELHCLQNDQNEIKSKWVEQYHRKK